MGWMATFVALIDDLSAESYGAGMGLGSDADIDAAKDAIYTHLARLATPSLANDTMEPENLGQKWQPPDDRDCRYCGQRFETFRLRWLHEDEAHALPDGD